jgi:protein O-GlcNAc transferase
MINYNYQWTSSASSWNTLTAIDPLRQGIMAHQRGDLDLAGGHYIQALRARPNRALAAYLLGLIQIAKGMGLSSLPFLIRANLLQPDQGEYAEALLNAWLRSRRFILCETLIADCEARGLAIDTQRWRQWLDQCQTGDTNTSLALPELGLADLGVVAEPPDPMGSLATETPDHARMADLFARALQDYNQRNYHKLIAELEPLLEKHPDWGEGHHLLGAGLSMLNRLDRAEPALRRAITLLPGRSEIWDHLAILLVRMGQYEDAKDAYEQSLALNPMRPESWNNAADAAISRQDYDAGFQYALFANGLDQSILAAVFNLGRASLGRGDLDLAHRLFKRLLEVDPRHGGAEQKLGDLCLVLGEYDEAAKHYQRAIDINPSDCAAYSGSIFISHYLAREGEEQLLERARRYGQLLAKHARIRSNWTNSRDPDKKLRLGFVSGDLLNHPVGFFFVTVAEALTQSSTLELFAYPTTRQTDDMTDRIRRCFSHWTPIVGLDDDEASERIVADGIDILVDLSGHTGMARLGVFVRKPAPVQVTWLGYFGTTGLSQIDYMLTGPWDVPPGEEKRFVEVVWRLPHTRLCFSSPAMAIDVTPLPAAGGGPLTFGCFNNLKKLNDTVICLWARILNLIPDSRLYLKASDLGSEQARLAMLDRFRVLGVAPDRLLVEGHSPLRQYLEAYGQVDIALDPFPYTGGTTTIQALWMGVPVLTMAGNSLLARQGESMLKALGLTDWIACDEADYQDRAVRLAQNLASLGQLRRGLRQRLESSPLMDAKGFARDLEGAFKAMWDRWCREEARQG